MTALSGSTERAKPRSGYALRPPALAHPRFACSIALAGAALIALTMGAAGIPLARLPAALGLWGDAGSDARTRPARAVVDPDSADRRGRDGGRPARRIRRHHAGAVSQPAGRSRAGRRFLRRRAGRGGGDRLHRQPDRPELPLHAASIAAARGVCGLAGHDGPPLFDREPLGTDVDRDLPAGRHCDCRHRQCRHRASGLHRRRPPVARHHVLDAGLAERRDLAQARGAGAGAGARPDRLRLGSRAGSTCWYWARPRRFTAASMSSG